MTTYSWYTTFCCVTDPAFARLLISLKIGSCVWQLRATHGISTLRAGRRFRGHVPDCHIHPGKWCQKPRPLGYVFFARISQESKCKHRPFDSENHASIIVRSPCLLYWPSSTHGRPAKILMMGGGCDWGSPHKSHMRMLLI